MAEGKLISDSEEAYEFTCTPCGLEDVTRKALYQCLDCDAFYCASCLKDHNRLPNLRTHQMLDEAEMRPSASKIQTPLPTERCKEHHGKLVDMFCADHDTVCCSSCISIYHRSCNKVDYVPTVAVGTATSTKLKETLSNGKALQENLLSAKQVREENLELLSTEEEELIGKVDEYESLIVKLAREMALRTKEDIRKQCATLKEKLTEECLDIDDPLTAVKEFIKKIEKSESNESQLFVNLKSGNTVLNTGKILAEKLSKSLCTQHLSYIFNDDIVGNIKKHTSFGEVNERLTLTGATIRTMDVRVSENENLCDITNVAELIDGSVLLTDFANKKLKRVRQFSGVLDWIDVLGSPMSVCQISKSEVAVSLRQERKIQFVSIEKPMKLTTSFSTPDQCNRLCYDEDRDELFVCCGGTRFNSIGQVHVYCRNGNLKRSFGKEIFSTPVDIKLNKEKSTLYVADREKGVFVLDILGNIKWSVTNGSLKDIWSVAEGTDDEVFTCGYRSGNVCLLSKDGLILSKVESISYPISIHLNKQSKQLLVCRRDDSLQIYTLQKEYHKPNEPTL